MNNDTPKTDSHLVALQKEGAYADATAVSADFARELERKNARLREVLQRVAKEADFSQCPGLEDAVDFVLFGLPNTQTEPMRCRRE